MDLDLLYVTRCPRPGIVEFLALSTPGEVVSAAGPRPKSRCTPDIKVEVELYTVACTSKFCTRSLDQESCFCRAADGEQVTKSRLQSEKQSVSVKNPFSRLPELPLTSIWLKFVHLLMHNRNVSDAPTIELRMYSRERRRLCTDRR